MIAVSNTTLEPIGPALDPALEKLAIAIAKGDPVALARSITLVESQNPDKQRLAQALLGRLRVAPGRARRIGITGVPGVGKSTLIDQLGSQLTAAGHKLAVLAVDPSSTVSGGSILGDKTRMAKLSGDPNAFIRPSPTSGTLGGVAARTREAILLVEAAGFDIVLIETVGAGQSETAVAQLVDFFLVLALAGAGDELQGIKKGVLELADGVAVNKADGDNIGGASRAAAGLRAALDVVRRLDGDRIVPVLTVSAITGGGLDELWRMIETSLNAREHSGELASRRAGQAVAALHDLMRERLLALVIEHPDASARLAAMEGAVRAGTASAGAAVDSILEIVLGKGCTR